ncbi:MAG: 3-isopropylmalate dehydrogenase [Candidatus Omnitrophica bacterium]|nr:3-isopropylmalate dehydrogenase [Candidatus Omnitrophota bacterium]
MTAERVYKIGVLPGDGTGPEVVREGMKVLDAASKLCSFRYEATPLAYGGERYLRTGTVLTDEELEGLKRFDTLYLGAVGHPDVKPGVIEKGLLLKIRFGLEQYINLRPVKLYPGVDTPLKDKGPEEIDFTVVRENNEGLYCGEGSFEDKGTQNETALQISRNTRRGVERCLRFAFEYTRARGKRKKLTLCGKTNVLTYAWDLWERVFYEVAKEYPDVTTDYAHVDATCMWMVMNPEWFDVIVTDNMFGDIITDLGAMIQGGLGIAAGGNINPEGVSMFEPIGGSAPKYTGKNIINPLAAISAAGMLLDWLGEKQAARMIEEAVMFVTSKKIKSLAAGKMGYSTSEVGDLIVDFMAGQPQKKAVK